MVEQEAKELIEQIRQHAEENNDLKLYKLINELEVALRRASASDASRGDQTSVGNITGSTGVAIGRDAQAHVDQSHNVTDVHQVFQNIYKQLEALPAQDAQVTPKAAANAQIEVAKLEAEALKGEEADESFLAERFRNIALMGEDILDVVTTTLLNPAAGIATVVRKIAEKAREEAGLQTT